MKETFKPIEFGRDELNERYSHLYEISDAGKVRSIKTQNQLKSFRNKQTGFLIVNMLDDKKRCLQPNVGRLVHSTFTGKDCSVHYKNGDIVNNYLWNLEDAFGREYEVQNELGMVFSDYIEAANAVDVPVAKVRRCCRGLIRVVKMHKGTTTFKHKEQEIWLPNEISPTIEVSTFGRVRDGVTGNFVNDMPIENIARLVCETFIAEPTPVDGVEFVPIFGIAGDKDCSFHNLRWGRK